jgi:hypothetical protein
MAGRGIVGRCRTPLEGPRTDGLTTSGMEVGLVVGVRDGALVGLCVGTVEGLCHAGDTLVGQQQLARSPPAGPELLALL